MKLDQVPAAVDRVGGLRHAEQVLHLHLVQGTRFMFLRALRCGDLNGNVGRLKSRNLILVRVLWVSFVSRTVGEMKIERIRTLADEHAFARQADAWRRRVG